MRAVVRKSSLIVTSPKLRESGTPSEAIHSPRITLRSRGSRSATARSLPRPVGS
jgi:hypothetical protein